jgi:hypothetical protein
MSLKCGYLRRLFVPYLEGQVSPARAARLEKHLHGCRACSEFLGVLQAGHEAGRRFGLSGLETAPPPPEYEEIRARCVRPGVRRAGSAPGILHPALWPRGIVAAVVTGLALCLFAVVERHMPRRAGIVSAASRGRANREFTPLRIGDFSSSPGSPIVTEGFVNAVYFDEEENTLHIKLVEAPHAAGPFVICEMTKSRGLAVPAEGSRVRVYGMARFDAQPGRGWNEVNPVTNIDVLKR